MAAKKQDDKLGTLNIDIIKKDDSEDVVPFDVVFKTTGTVSTRDGLIALISAIGMIVEDVVRTGMSVEFKDVSSDEEIAELQDLVLAPLMDLLGSQLGMVENSLAYIMAEVEKKEPQLIRDLFTEPTVGDDNVGDSTE